MANIWQTEGRGSSAKSTVEKAGGKFDSDSFPYLALGKYDTVAIIEVPNDEAITSAILSIASLGNTP